MSKKLRRPDLDEQAQAVLYAAIYGDDAACARFKLAARTLRNYRALARDPESDLAATCRKYRDALGSEEARTEAAAQGFADWLTTQARAVSALLLEKAQGADARNPEALRVLNEHFASILDHKTTTVYIDRLFAPTDDDDPEGDPEA